MAVVQISKIQLRRGKKNTGTGLPQLASGELAWAIDTQELYIGNGSVGEGAPAVGNTKVLTSKDSILELASTYQYRFDTALGESIVEGTISRTLQSRLDDSSVNARNFGIKSVSELLVDDIPDQSAKLQIAVNELAGTRPVALEFDPGTYTLEDTVVFPSNVKIVGSGKDVTVFNFTGTGTIFDTVEEITNLNLKDFTVRFNQNNVTCLNLNSALKNEFSNIKFAYNTIDNTYQTPVSNRIGIKFTSNSTLIPDNKFKGIEFTYLTYAVTDFTGTTQGSGTISLNTFDKCVFDHLYKGLYLGNSTGGASYNTVTNSVFDQIYEEAYLVTKGTGNRSRSNTYKNVGTNTSGYIARTGVIKFVDSGNSSLNDTFDRITALEPAGVNTFTYKPLIEGTGSYTVAPTKLVFTDATGVFQTAFRLPLNGATSYKVDYVLRSTEGDYMKRGSFHISTDQANPFNIQFVDEYDYAGLNPVNESATMFDAQPAGTTTPYIVVRYKNIIAGDVINFTYTYTQLS